MSIIVEKPSNTSSQEKVAQRIAIMTTGNGQEDRMARMEREISQGRSVLAGSIAYNYTSIALTSLVEHLLATASTVQEYMLCSTFHYENAVNPEMIATVMSNFSLLGEGSPFPRDNEMLLWRMKLLGSMNVAHTVTIAGLFSGLIPLTPQETKRMNRLRKLFDDYYNVDQTEMWGEILAWNNAGDRRAGKAITTWAREIKEDLWNEVNALTGPLRGLDTGNVSITYHEGEYQYSGAQGTAPMLRSPIDLHRQEVNGHSAYAVVELLTAVHRCYQGVEKNGVPSKKLARSLELRLESQLGEDEKQAISSLIPSEGDEFIAGSNAEWGLPPQKVLSTLAEKASTLTWDQLSTFASLVQEYNEEWALAAMEWG